ncbi:hypothetical protein QJS66_06300 [Kocuria rhizophila]|nr:hypothetical protein QJS66_06300 [Kocuria rhizophila]
MSRLSDSTRYDTARSKAETLSLEAAGSSATRAPPRLQVRRQRHGRRPAAPRVRGGHRLPAPRGTRPVVVHGGGPQISAMLQALGIHSRVPGTGCGSPREEAVNVIRMVLTGQVGRELRAVHAHGCNVVGMSGRTPGCCRPAASDGSPCAPLDLGSWAPSLA